MLKVYNTLAKKKEAFKPLGKEVKIYSCGPTVYDYAHIGNFRSYIFADLLHRYLLWKGWKVKQVMNITDVGHMTIDEEADQKGEDKVEKAAKEKGKTPEEIARFYEKAFQDDRKDLNILDAWKYPRASEHVKEMVGIIAKLLDNGFAYKAKGGVYYDVTKFPGYGKLSGNTLAKLKAGHRVEVREEKKNPLDFALWIINPKHVMQWDSPFGRGYPGWHVECSAMSMKYLGESFDLHTGGEDNIFPHHECEIAQSESATGKPFVKYWMHARHLQVNGEKMSKRLGNFYTFRDLLGKGYSWKAIRYGLMAAHYRATLNFTEESLKASEEAVRKLENLVAELKSYQGKGTDGLEVCTKARKAFEAAMDDDLNLPEAMAAVFDFVSKANALASKKGLSQKGAKGLLEQILGFDKVLGLKLDGVSVKQGTAKYPGGQVLWKNMEPNSAIQALVIEREEARSNKDWEKADEIRERVRALGYLLEDKRNVTIVSKA